MKLQNLRDVVAIAEQGSLRGAARRLGTVQPTLTRSLSGLERELGAPLFERRSKGMMVTPLGQAFVRRATAILNDVRRAQEEFEQLRGNAVGLVTIGLSIAAHLQLLPKTLQQFRQRYPKVRLRIIEGFYPTLESNLKEGDVDFYIGPDPGLTLPPALQKQVLFSGGRAVLCRAKHPLANATSLKELVHARYGLPDPMLALQSQSALTLLTCLANSDLLAMAPTQWVESPLASRILSTIPVKEELSAASIIAVTRSEAPLVPAATFLLDLMKRVAGHPSSAKRRNHSLKAIMTA